MTLEMEMMEYKITKALSNSGNDNTGASNTGSLNCGDKNVGGCNTGMLNIGDYNCGDENQGDFNTGKSNLGDFNTGDFNIGDYNTGDFNLCNSSAGAFCTQVPTMKFFDKDSNITLDQWRSSDAYKILSRVITAFWINKKEMTFKEKLQHPEYKITGGYLKEIEYKEGFANLWKVLDDREKDIVIHMPNFDKEKFLQITGIDT